MWRLSWSVPGSGGDVTLWKEASGAQLKLICPHACKQPRPKLTPNHALLCAAAQAPVWRVSWSVTGSVLSVSDSGGGVTLWKEALDGEWQQLSN